MKKKLTCVSLFSGGGGLDLGLEAAGFDTLYATDIDYHSCTTLAYGKERAKARGKPVLKKAKIRQADIAELDGQGMLAELGLKKRDVDLLAGGPPCQAFSVFGRRKGTSDPRGRLVEHYLRLLKDLEPKSFLFENVYGLLSIEKGKVFEEIKSKLANPKRGLRYKLSILRLDAVDYGVPQFRDRVFILGTLDGPIISDIPKLTGDRKDLFADAMPRRTVRDALHGLPKIGDTSVPNHTGRKHSERIIKRYASMKPGERDHYTRINKLDLDRPSFTIIVGSDAGGGKGHIHPIEPREVTPRESARIQTFPDWWEFSGTSRHPIRQVGNAIPPLLASAIGNEIRVAYFQRKAIPLDERLELLDQQHLFETYDAAVGC